VIEDATNANWSPSQNGYVINSGTNSISAPVQATNGGVQGNVAADTITVLLNAIPGVDFVNNASTAATVAVDAETDAAFRIRFQLFLLGLASATNGAIQEAVASVQAGLTYQVVGNANPDGSSHLGYVTVFVDDGSGSPPSPLLAAVTNAVAGVVSECISFGVFGPTVVTANIAGVITVGAGYNLTTAETAAEAALQAYVQGLSFGGSLPYSRLFQLIYDAYPGITDVTGLTLNGGTSDLTASVGHVIRPGTISLT
jgi:uncharacterized phage protein gp47/JayE